MHQNNQLAPIQEVHNVILSQEAVFNSVNSAPNDIAFYREAEFATQLLQSNDFLLKTAMSNRDSLINSIKNVAAIGISLNPAQKLAYLVPRDRQVKLDISYHGLIWLAVEAGAIQWAQAKIVYAADKYRNTGIDSEPLHEYDPFDSNRGEIRGAYVVAKTSGGDFLTHEMSIKDIYDIRARSPSFKGGRSSPWKTDEAAMIKKTVVRQASTYWPKVARLRKAEEYLNTQMDQGIDLNGGTYENVNLEDSQKNEIRFQLSRIGRTEDQMISILVPRLINKSLNSIDELSGSEAEVLINYMKELESN